MASELDPLLPKNQPAPEISGYGYSQILTTQYGDQGIQDEGDEDLNEKTSPAPSPLNTILALFTIVVSFALFVALLVPGGLGSSWKDTDNETSTIKARVNQILSENPLIDGHNDLAIFIRGMYKNRIYDPSFAGPFKNGGLEGHVDLTRLKQGRSGGAFLSAYVGCPKNGTDFSDANYAETVSITLSQLDLLHRLGEVYPEVFLPANLDSSSALAEFKAQGKFISPIGIEGLHQIGNSYSNLRMYQSLGVHYATLTHLCHNAYADAAVLVTSENTLVAAEPYWGGVSKRGRQVVAEMNRIGMLVDLSHVSKDTMLDVLGGRPEKWNGSVSPVMFSHSSAYSLCPHPRNVPDDVLELVKKTRSIVMVNFAPEFISCVASNSTTGMPDEYIQNATLHQVARHITYIGGLIGYDHVGIGSDYDGIFEVPRGLEDVSKFPDLVAELLEMGVSDKDAAKIVGLNVLRVWADAEKTSLRLIADGAPVAEDKVPRMSHI